MVRFIRISLNSMLLATCDNYPLYRVNDSFHLLSFMGIGGGAISAACT